MPAADSRDTLARQWELLKLIPARGNGASAAELHRQLEDLGFSTTRRSVERDLNVLATRFPLTTDALDVRPQRWRWIQGTALNVPGISLAEALSLNIIENTLRPLLPTAVLGVLDARWQQARDKLTDLGETNRHAPWVDKVRVVPPGPALHPPTIGEGVLEAVQDGLARARQLNVRHRRAGAGEPTQMILHPLALVQSGPTSYLLASANDYEDVRSYALQRFQMVEVLEDQARRPDGFEVDVAVSRVMQFGSGQEVRLRARVYESLANILKETPLSSDQTLGGGRKGWHTLTATVTDTWALRRWLMGHSDELVVSHPASIRRDIAARLKDALEAYGAVLEPDKSGD